MQGTSVQQLVKSAQSAATRTVQASQCVEGTRREHHGTGGVECKQDAKG